MSASILPAYKSHKTVRAAKIAMIELGSITTRLWLESGAAERTPHDVTPEWIENRKAEVGGYLVVYEDGYESFSPAKAFEEGYTRADQPRTVDHLIEAQIIGTRKLSDAEAALMNEGKALAEQCGAYIAKLREHASCENPNSPGYVREGSIRAYLQPPLDQRWISIGATDLQRGWMAVMRGIAQPTTF